MLLERLHSYFTVRIRKDWNFRKVMEIAPAMRWLSPRARERILDIGCGDGTYDYRVSRRGALVLGFDIDKKRLGTAARHNAGRGVLFIKANAEAIPVKSASFDAVMSFCVFEHLQNDNLVLAEAHRALRSDGRLLLTLDSMSLPEVSENWRNMLRKKHAVRQFYTVPSIESKLRQGGFRLTRCRYILSSPLDVRLLKWSYATERIKTIPAALVRTFLVTAGRWISHLANAGSKSDNGWTLMIEASKA